MRKYCVPLIGVTLHSAPIRAQVHATLLGSVVDEADAALAGVELRVLGSALVASTGADGHFRFDRLSAGVHVLYARKFGYRARQFTVDVMSSDTMRIEIQLEKNAQVLPTATIVATSLPNKLIRVGFEERRAYGLAPPSQFITQEDIELRKPLRVSDMFNRMAARAQRCKEAGTVFVDGLLTTDPVNVFGRFAVLRKISGRYDAIDFVAPEEVVGVEVYVGAQVPARFNITRRPGTNTQCVVAIWTR